MIPQTVKVSGRLVVIAAPTGPFALERSVLLRRVGDAVDDATEPCLLVRWRNLGKVPLKLWVRPLLGWCDADHLLPVDSAFDGSVQAQGASWGVRPSPILPVLWLTVDGVAAFRADPVWYRGFLYT